MKTVQKSIHIAITLLVLLAHPTIVSANAVNKEAKLTISEWLKQVGARNNCILAFCVAT